MGSNKIKKYLNTNNEVRNSIYMLLNVSHVLITNHGTHYGKPGDNQDIKETN